jgi:two-component system chemotaxis response regulator CheB
MEKEMKIVAGDNELPKFIVVIGASAGGLPAIKELVAGIIPDTDAAFFVAIHISQLADREGFVRSIQQLTSISCTIAVDGEPIHSHHLYIAEPGKHLLVKNGNILFGNGPTENRWRPSIDVLFRSAAASYNSRVIGIILTGMLQDGTAGMIAIRKCGGTCIVQDPAQAEYPDMARSVLDNVTVDYCLPLQDIPTVIKEKTDHGFPDPYPIAERTVVDMDILKEIGIPTDFTCPDCGGSLWEMKNENIKRYRCFTGHVYTQDEYNIKQKEALESTLWVALRMMEERKQLMDKMTKEELSKGRRLFAEKRVEKSNELSEHIERLKVLLFDSRKV